MIQLRNLNKVYKGAQGEFHAVKDLNLDIREDDFYGIMGLSGAGKSTLIRMINRLEEPTSGEIVVNGENILEYSEGKLREFRKKTGMIFQHFNLLQSRTVEGNVAFALEVAGWDKKKIPERVEELLNLVELGDKARSYPAQLSGGQKQRVAIARALANNPKILLSDEATSALDPKTTKSILELLKNLQEKLGLTIVLITHQMEVIRSACNRAAIMDRGEVVEVGKVEEVFANPKTDIAREFVSHLAPDEKDEVELVKVPGRKIVKLSYMGRSVEKPLISQMIRRFDIDASIVAGSIDKLVTESVGHLILELSGEKQDLAIEWIRDHEVGVEVIYNG
ncbi:methionine import ATP-binding protein MetN [Propionigenium maris DSM 9537]|uniref:Methionine import ATP-binding protein MetN n=1 Tax=Propionigenium maris DSM 9537 TaxID=1123000 RepID=A0A9W6LLF1_9FUSO|nr:ATP-binding cassette domain-containing protein [Propionigenium maris]GLI54617.1 methionine import ATP-binding protein MetN [Propionigenium maris DSM 9537]